MSNSNFISVSQFNNYIKNIFDNEELLINITLLGEISGISVTSGNAYFSLKDKDALLNCIMFNYAGTYKVGDKVLVTGSPKYYSKGGKLSFQASKIVQYGEGELLKQFLLLKESLERQGFFDIQNKKQLPKKINKIGVISSKQGAVIQDIYNIVSRRNPFIKIVLYPAQVQGIYAERDIIKGIKYFENSDVDIIIVARGGGSAEDLAVFNSELIATTVFNCTKFILSAVGHETDYTIIDYVSDLRAPTPSAAAELISKDIIKDCEMLVAKFSIIEKLMEAKLIKIVNNNAINKNKATNIITNKIATLSNIVNDKYNRVKSIINTTISNCDNTIKQKALIIEKINPMTKLLTGYSRLKHKGIALKSVKDVEINSEIENELLDGILISIVTQKKEKV